jgi:hypothetical protein
MNPVMGHQWEDLFQVPRVAEPNRAPVGKIVSVTHLCCECTYAQLMRHPARCRCTHPSSEFADGVVFAGVPACAAFAPRHHHARDAFTNGSGGAAILHGN